MIEESLSCFPHTVKKHPDFFENWRNAFVLLVEEFIQCIAALY